MNLWPLRLLWLLALVACGSRREPQLPAVSPPPPVAAVPAADEGAGYRPTAPAYQRGEASYYHDGLAGNRTAGGEIYDPSQLTAAHRKLPFGTVIDVVRDDGRWVRVRVNDRGPFIRGRVVDVSRRAAEHIGLIRPGVAGVTIYVVSQP